MVPGDRGADLLGERRAVLVVEADGRDRLLDHDLDLPGDDTRLVIVTTIVSASR